MIAVTQISEGVRKEGLNYGLPTVFVKLGPGSPYPQVEELVRDVLTLTKCTWVCILGEDTTQVGIGSLVKGLSAVGLNVELECSGKVKDPGWLRSVDRWLVDLVQDGIFNLGALRSQDMIRFTISTEDSLGALEENLRSLPMFPGTKAINVTSSKLVAKVFQVARKYPRTRIYLPA